MKKIKINSLLFCAFFALVFSSCDPALKTDDLPVGAVVGSIKDVDGNFYRTIKIGSQTWMVENLKTNKYNDGSAIPAVTDNTVWRNLTTGACCNYNNDAANAAKYGKLYNWYAVNTGKLAPAGWHVPTDAEWTTLENYVKANLGASVSVAKALAATTDWDASTSAGVIGNDLKKNNSSGFSALSGGNRDSNGTFDHVGNYGAWWSSTEIGSSHAWYRNLYYSDEHLSQSNYDKQDGFSVRLIKD
ncbi:MAG: fibrobacter succinogenes major paralogous domain-containing protein [Paludibacter sp.]